MRRCGKGYAWTVLLICKFFGYDPLARNNTQIFHSLICLLCSDSVYNIIYLAFTFNEAALPLGLPQTAVQLSESQQ